MWNFHYCCYHKQLDFSAQAKSMIRKCCCWFFFLCSSDEFSMSWKSLDKLCMKNFCVVLFCYKIVLRRILMRQKINEIENSLKISVEEACRKLYWFWEIFVILDFLLAQNFLWFLKIFIRLLVFWTVDDIFLCFLSTFLKLWILNPFSSEI